MRQLKSE